MSTPRNPIPPKHFAPLQSTDVKSCPRMSKPTWGKRERIRILFYVLPHMVLFLILWAQYGLFHCLAGFHRTNSVFCSFLPFPFLQGRHCSNRSGRHGKSFTSTHLSSLLPSLSISINTHYYSYSTQWIFPSLGWQSYILRAEKYVQSFNTPVSIMPLHFWASVPQHAKLSFKYLWHVKFGSCTCITFLYWSEKLVPALCKDLTYVCTK